jgi:8-oxo-dGTP pyrophosphatase MutT (NUDIX family)
LVIGVGFGQQGRDVLSIASTPDPLASDAQILTGDLRAPMTHLDPGEGPQQGVVREALEETARVFTPTALVGVYLSRFVRPATGEDITYLRLAYAGRAGEPVAGRALDQGIVRTVWMSPEEVRASRARHRSPLVLRCIEDHLAGKRLPLQAVWADATVHEPPQEPTQQPPQEPPHGAGPIPA